MDNEDKGLKRLHEISDKEWSGIIIKLKAYVHFKLKGKTLYGAHSEKNLGINAIDYYVNNAIEKLFSMQWKWKYDRYSLPEQLERIIGSMISANVEKYRNKNNKIIPIDNHLLSQITEDTLSHESLENDEMYLLFRKALENCSSDSQDLLVYVNALDICSSFEEMEIQTGFEKKNYMFCKRN